MNHSEQIIRSAIAGLLALGVSAASSQAIAAAGDNEKCAGIVKAGKNDCGTSKSSCAGTAKVDRDPEAWVYVPKGTCDKIAGGTVTTSAHAKPGGAAGK
ncbi:MAG: DUF2282 domain-containing protein [Candidatus Accumulibacter phosphatis]|jgi:uncharacterized membrane protein|uniref:DUF2282 domain-containing protein n=2 Tax=Candidatus Accumulibacter TaxID=327159 RepID=A0ABX1T4A8_9PROT|nr:DUF2282 domain-containing protein [Candidatus Accumulibacter contiguus]KFB74082.1 MAG: putative integral membrane protein [Candidatus Accumulibacter phosphatis]MBL8407964.1 DUF2282 domain-containing protein [Accumulibacter sp.]NMQ04492.1 DUF2282 domain-containing protein [Candidatus Accumulibacter contiguus]